MMDYTENIEFLKMQLSQTQQWLENNDQSRTHFVVTMIIKGMIDTEHQIAFFENLMDEKKAIR